METPFFVIASAVLFVILYTETTLGAPLTCQVPSNLSLQYDTLVQYNKTVNFFFPPSLADGQATCNWDITKTAHDSLTYGTTTCPSETMKGADIPVYARSTCPWYYVASHDPQRYPSTYITAKPRCVTCIGSKGDLDCIPITQNVEYMQQVECVSGLYRYEKRSMEIAVGYTCGGRKTVNNTSSSIDYA
ncbi:hypothetical protein ACJMK2_011809 [Sinanodonta woodiana]|uniref:Uncharacterized protein n=1 Tax=Sinanodonta woodiana TaxID=1069815 RepID=A0ABD3V688_SINWO